MRIISTKTLRDWQASHANQAQRLEDWYNVARRAHWHSVADCRADFPQADQVGSCLVFNIGSNFRLICGVVWATDRKQGIFFLKHFLTHKVYDRDAWKKDCDYDT